MAKYSRGETVLTDSPVEQGSPKVDVIVLMAGKGKRLLPLTKDRPKSLLFCEGGMSIFEHIVRAFVSYSWSPTIIPVIGHGHRKVYEELERLSALAQYSPAANPFYDSAGPLVSLWLGLLRSCNEKVVILNGDTLIREPLVTDLARWITKTGAAGKYEVGACVTTTAQYQPDDMKILLGEKGSFKRAGKDIVPAAGVVKSAGVIALRDRSCKEALKAKLDDLLMGEKALGTRFYWHNILNEIKEQFEIGLIEVAPDSWYEVDTNFDLNSINESSN